MANRSDLEERLKAKIFDALTDFVGKKNTGHTREEIAVAVTKALSEKIQSPAVAIQKTDNGPVLVLDMSPFIGCFVKDLRAAGMDVSESIPDWAKVVRDKGRVVYEWLDVETAP